MISFQAFSQRRIIKKDEIRDGISPKSVVASGNGLFSAQNMMYRHTITIYDAKGNRRAKINDEVRLADFGFSEYGSYSYKGGPVEAEFTADGKFLWVSNYNMFGEGFEKPGCDACHGDSFDPGFLYKINTATYEIENVVRVGAVPKFLAISPDESILLVSNWTSGDVSIIDLETETEIKRVYVGSHPRGIDITEDSKTAFITVMGSTKIAELDLNSYALSYISDIGRSPRSLILCDSDSSLLISLNSGSNVLKYNRFSRKKTYCKTGSGPRSMTLSPQEDFLYVVNYFDNSFSKINTASMTEIERVETADKPIGICANWEQSEIWVACYSGSIEIFKDFHLDSIYHGTSMLGFDLSSFWSIKYPKTEEGDLNEKADSIVEKVEIDSLSDKEELEPIVKVSHLRPKKPMGEIQKNRFPDKKNQENCGYHVIAGSFSEIANAEKRKAELESKGYIVIIIPGKLNYVSAACYTNRSEAEIGVKDIQSNTGYSAWILKR